MAFNSICFFVLLFADSFLLYHLSPQRLKNAVALLGSLLFYAWGEPYCVLLIAAATFVNYNQC